MTSSGTRCLDHEESSALPRRAANALFNDWRRHFFRNYTVLPPPQAVPLIMLLSTCNQMLSGGRLRREKQPFPSGIGEGSMPCIVGGLVGRSSAFPGATPVVYTARNAS